MTTEALDRSRNSATVGDVDERAQAAVKVFRGMVFSLTGYARAITGNKNVRIEIATGPPRTDGNVIYYRPPIALGDKRPHDRFNCDKRDAATGLQICPACRVREEVLVNIYHEIAHIAFGTFEKTSDRAKLAAIELAVKEWGGKYEEQIRQRINSAPAQVRNSYMGLTSLISPFMPYLYNCLEDARVDSSMFEARKGTRKMLQADTFNLLRDGIPSASGELQLWNEAPMNSQISIACYLDTAGYIGWQDFMHPAIADAIADAQVSDLLAKVKGADSAAVTYSLAFPLLARLRELGFFMLPEEEPDEKEETPDDSTPEPDADDADPAGGDESRGDAGETDGQESVDSGPDQGEAGAPSDEPTPDAEGSEAADVGSGSEDAPEGSEGDEGHGEGGDGVPEGDASGDDGEGTDGVPEGAGEVQDAPEAGDEPQEGEVDNGADQDGVPEGAAEPGDDAGDGEDSSGDAGAEPSVEGEAGDAPSDDGEADAPDEGAAGGSGTPDGGPLGEDVSDEADHDEASEADGGVSQPDDASGDWPEGDGSESGEASGPEGVSDDAEGSDESTDGGAQGQSEGEADRPEVMESGADEGLGGIEVAPVPEYGTPDDVRNATERAHEVRSPDVEETVEEEKAVTTAIIQGAYFETPSVGVTAVEEHRYSPNGMAWNSAKFDADVMVYLGITCDMDIPESVLGPALLKTRRVFSDNKTSHYEPNLRSGKINKKVLGRRAWNDDDRLFGKKRIPGKKDYAVLISMDLSSSNLGDNLALLKRSVFAQAELCHRAGIAFEIVGHSANRGYTLHLHHIKDFDEPWNTEVKNRIGDLIGTGGNLDGHALEFMRKRLTARTETDKILLYYTDGKMPAANKEEELVVLQRQIKLCKRDRINLLGVGIRTDSPVRHGLDTVEVRHDEDLPKVIEHLGKRLAQSAR